MTTSTKVASNAGKVLKNGKKESTTKVKSVAGSSLSQTKTKKSYLKKK